MANIKLDKNLYAQARKIAEAAGYKSVDELVVHLIERESARYGSDSSDDQVAERLRALGYID